MTPLPPMQNPAFAGLQSGRIVNFVLTGSKIRPMIVTQPSLDFLATPEDPGATSAKPTGVLNGIVLLDGSNDDGGSTLLTRWMTSIPFDSGKSAGTWHWPDRAGAPVFVTQAYLDAAIAQIKEDTTEACAALLVSDSFKTAVNETVVESQKAVEAVEGLPIEDQNINDLKAEMAELREQWKKTMAILQHHGLNGPADVEPEQSTLVAPVQAEDVQIQNHGGAPNPGRENAEALSK